MDAMEAFDRVASFGVMIEDESRGRVRRRADGSPRITYWMSPGDAKRIHRGMLYIAEIFKAAGARKIFPIMPRFPSIEGDADFERFRAMRPRPWDYVITSFHPIGTCRMGRDPKTSVVGLDHQTHDVPGLFIVDGSTVPGPPAVNPQLTIMAMANRAAGKIAERLG
jgi:choline dehydrogenase-like flavoprotein